MIFTYLPGQTLHITSCFSCQWSHYIYKWVHPRSQSLAGPDSWLTIRWLIITFIHVTNWMDIFQQIAPFTHYQCFIINQPNHLQCWLLPESQKKNNSCKKYFVNSPHRLTPAWEGRTGRGWSYQNNPIFRLFKSFFSRILNLSITWEVSLWNNK